MDSTMNRSHLIRSLFVVLAGASGWACVGQDEPREMARPEEVVQPTTTTATPANPTALQAEAEADEQADAQGEALAKLEVEEARLLELIQWMQALQAQAEQQEGP